MVGQQELSQGFEATRRGLEAAKQALVTTIDEVSGLARKSESQEQRYLELLDILREMSERSADAAKWRKAAEERMEGSFEERIAKLEDAG